MRATITNPLAVKAAANLANGGYPYSIFQVRREGGSAKVCGMNGYTSIAVTVPATFARWPDGKSLTLGKESVRAMMRGIGKSLKSAQSISFETVKGSVTVSVEADGATAQTSFALEADGLARNKAVEKFNWEGVSAGQECEAEDIAVNPYFVKLASHAMDTLKTGKPCDFKPCGGSAALRMDMSAEEVSACALVVPFARRYA